MHCSYLRKRNNESALTKGSMTASCSAPVSLFVVIHIKFVGFRVFILGQLDDNAFLADFAFFL